MVNILIGSDHAGYDIKTKIIQHLNNNFTIENLIDIGPFNDDRCDYPDIAHTLCNKLIEYKEQDMKYIGILICGTGIGMSITANKHKDIRCALCHNEYTAEMTRLHNNSNVLALGSRVLDEDMIMNIVNKFINTDFEGGRHLNRVNKIEI
tara:strand:- start:357 stop:806 length:450 start_codon:yes stop_codon:yes gene_type:complete